MLAEDASRLSAFAEPETPPARVYFTAVRVPACASGLNRSRGRLCCQFVELVGMLNASVQAVPRQVNVASARGVAAKRVPDAIMAGRTNLDNFIAIIPAVGLM